MIDVVRPSQDDYYLGMAVAISWRGSCQTRKVGAVLVRDNRIISTGYNGPASGELHCGISGACPRCDETVEKRTDDSAGLGRGELDLCVCVHAEGNAIASAARSSANLNEATAYITDAPCISCANEMIQSGIIQVHYLRSYSHPIDDPVRQENISRAHEKLKSRLKAERHDPSVAIQGLSNFLNSDDMKKFYTQAK